MKKLISIFILIFIIGSMLMGCSIVTPENEGDPDGTPGGGGPDDDPEPIYTVGTRVGNLMEAVELNKIDGSGSVSIEDYKGKIIIFNLWATWCGPCINELPHFSEFAEEYASDVVIIAAHVSSNNGNAYSYVNTNFKSSRIVFAYDTLTDEAYRAAGGNGYIPYTVILDRSGVITYSDSGPLSYQQLEQLVAPLK